MGGWSPRQGSGHRQVKVPGPLRNMVGVFPSVASLLTHCHRVIVDWASGVVEPYNLVFPHQGVLCNSRSQESFQSQ